MNEKIKNITKNFFSNFWIEIDDIIIEEKETNIFLIKILSPESWLIIWPHWKNLDNISMILKLIIKKNISKDLKIHIEINDYMKSKDDRLKDFILAKIKIVEKNWIDIKLPFYSAYERKKIHSIVWENWNSRIYTKSIWEWNERRLYICKKDEKLTIDIDWNDI